MRRRTIREWMDFIGTDNKNELYGIKMEDGLPCKLKNYKPVREFFKTYSGYLDDIVINVYPKNLKQDGKNYVLFITEKEEPFDYTNKTEKEIFEHLLKKAEKRNSIQVQENEENYIKIWDSSEYYGTALVFNEHGKLINIKSEG